MSSDKEINVRDYYNRFAEYYDLMYEKIQIEKFQSILDKIKNQFFDGIDLGGGTGLLSNFLNYPLITLDISYNMLLHGLHLNRSFLPVCGDLQFLPLRDRSINFAISVTAFQNTSNLMLSFKELKRILFSKKNAIITILSKKVDIKEITQILEELDFRHQEFELPIEDIGLLLKI